MLTLVVRNEPTDQIEVRMVDTNWNGALGIACILWVLGLAGCMFQALSPLTSGVVHWLLVGAVVVAAGAAGLAFRMIRHGRMIGNIWAECAAFVLLIIFGPVAFIFAAGAVPFLALRLRRNQRILPNGEVRVILRLLIARTSGMALLSLLGLILWTFPVYARLTEWAGSHAAHFPPSTDASAPWWAWVATLMIGIAFVSFAYIAAVWWQRLAEMVVVVDASVARRRQAFSDRLTSLLHDGVLSTLERVAAGQPLNDMSRSRVGILAQTIRSGLFNDTTPRSTAHFINGLVEQCSLHGAIPNIADFVDGDPPVEVLQAFQTAASAVLANLDHASVSEATIGIVGDRDKLHVTISDEGRGFDLSRVEWSPHTSRAVFDGLAALVPQAEVKVDSEPGRGATWQLRWPAEAPR